VPAPTLALRITRVMLILFVVLQAGVFMITALPHRQPGPDFNDLPAPARMAAMVEAMDAVPPERRAAVAEAFDGALYHVAVSPGPVVSDTFFAQRLAAYRAALPGRAIGMSGRHARWARLTGSYPWARWLMSPITLGVSLQGGEVLTVANAPSQPLRDLIRQRALIWGLGGAAALIALTLAVRATTRPIVNLARNIRAFAGRLDAPDLPVEGAREMQDLAIAYNEMKGRIAGLVAERTRILAAIAHDLRTYLTRLRLRCEFIDDESQRAAAAADLAEMAQLLDDTLLFAREGQPRAAPRQPVDLCAAIAETVALRADMGETVGFACPPGEAVAAIEPLALRRILANLLDNAARHAARVGIALERDDGHWRIEVADDGPGVPAAMLARLGAPFGRLDPSRDRISGGAGLGLAIVRALAEEQGGTVQFRNRPEGGFGVTILLPAASSGEPEPG
jgi:signal transduction histidine kinase